MRTYLVVIDDTDEAGLALRYASRRAQKTSGAVHILALAESEDFLAWGGAQATLEAEARSRAEALVASAAGTLFDETGIRPAITIKSGKSAKIVREMLDEMPDITALVLGASASGPPGPLVAHFAGTDMGSLPCPVFIIPGGLTKEEIDRLS